MARWRILAKIAHCPNWPRREERVRANQNGRQKQVSQSRAAFSYQLYVIVQNALHQNYDILTTCVCGLFWSSYLLLCEVDHHHNHWVFSSWTMLGQPCITLPSTSVASGCFKCHKPSTQFTTDNLCLIVVITRGCGSCYYTDEISTKILINTKSPRKSTIDRAHQYKSC